LSKLLLDLEDCQITDTGRVLMKYETLYRLFRNGKSDAVTGLTCLDDGSENKDVRHFNERNPARLIQIETPGDEDEVPPVDAYYFNLPDAYWDIHLEEFLATKLVEKFSDPTDQYLDRLALEIQMMADRQMDEFIRTLIYMVDVFEANQVVHGLGRGSSCASLVLYLIGIHMVDPVEYDIPITEFLR
jgi:hypothetical protein